MFEEVTIFEEEIIVARKGQFTVFKRILYLVYILISYDKRY